MHHGIAVCLCLTVNQVAAPFKPECGSGPSDSSNFAKFNDDEDIVVGKTNEYAHLFTDFWLLQMTI